jgi:hypothetical protein
VYRVGSDGTVTVFSVLFPSLLITVPLMVDAEEWLVLRVARTWFLTLRALLRFRLASSARVGTLSLIATTPELVRGV